MSLFPIVCPSKSLLEKFFDWITNDAFRQMDDPRTPEERPVLTSDYFSDSSPSDLSARGLPEIGCVDWNQVLPEKWLTEYRAHVKALTYHWASVIADAYRVIARNQTINHEDALALQEHLCEFWACWRKFGSQEQLGRHELLSSPVFFPVRSIFEHLRLPRLAQKTFRQEIADLRLMARILKSHFKIAQKVVEDIDQRALESIDQNLRGFSPGTSYP
jgi:hypothetical protein